PSAPVQALAQPLLTTIARATPFERARCSRHTTTGAATARLVVKTAAACAGVSDTTPARSRALLALMPAATPAARKPRAAVIPPGIVEEPLIYATGAGAGSCTPYPRSASNAESSGTTMPYCSHLRNSGHLRQSVITFSSS